MKRAALAIALSASAVRAEPSLVLEHQPPQLHMRPPDKAPDDKPAEPAPPQPPTETQIRDIHDQVAARVDLGYVVDATTVTGNPGYGMAAPPHTTAPPYDFATVRAYGFGEGYLSTRGIGFDSLSTYFATRFQLTRRTENFDPTDPNPNAQRAHDVTPPIATWWDRSGVEPRDAWAEIKDFMPQKWLSPLRVRAGMQYVYGPWVLHFDGAVVAWEGKLVRITAYSGFHRPDYTLNPLNPSDRAGIGGSSIKFDLRELSTPLPIQVSAETTGFTQGTGTTSTRHTLFELDWRPRTDFAVIGQARQLEDTFVNEHVQLRARYHQVTNLVFDVTHHSSSDWRWDPSVVDPDPVAARRYLDLGPVLPRMVYSLRAGTLIAENIDVYGRGAVAADRTPDGDPKSTYSPSYAEGGGALELRLRRTVAVGASVLSRATKRDDHDSSRELLQGMATEIPANDSSALGERNFTEVGATLRLTLGARKFNMLVEGYGRRTHYAHIFCSDCTMQTDPLIPDTSTRTGGRVMIDAWIGKQLRLFASYDLSGRLQFAPDITGYKSLRLMLEGIY